jgi:hypothetical protein
MDFTQRNSNNLKYKIVCNVFKTEIALGLDNNSENKEPSTKVFMDAHKKKWTGDLEVVFMSKSSKVDIIWTYKQKNKTNIS